MSVLRHVITPQRFIKHKLLIMSGKGTKVIKRQTMTNHRTEARVSLITMNQKELSILAALYI